MALVAIDVFKTRLGVTGTSQDGQLQQFLDEASAMVIDYCGRDFATRSYPGAEDDGSGDSGLYCGDGSRILIVRQRPITAISSLYLDQSAEWNTNPDGAFASATQLTEGRDFAVRWDTCLPGTTTKASKCGIIERIGNTWPAMALYQPGKLGIQAVPARGNIKIAYTAGYTTIPQAVQSAVMQIATLLRRNADKGAPMSSESLGGYSYSLAGPQLGQFPELGSVRAALSPWREVVI